MQQLTVWWGLTLYCILGAAAPHAGPDAGPCGPLNCLVLEGCRYLPAARPDERGCPTCGTLLCHQPELLFKWDRPAPQELVHTCPVEPPHYKLPCVETECTYGQQCCCNHNGKFTSGGSRYCLLPLANYHCENQQWRPPALPPPSAARSIAILLELCAPCDWETADTEQAAGDDGSLQSIAIPSGPPQQAMDGVSATAGPIPANMAGPSDNIEQPGQPIQEALERKASKPGQEQKGLAEASKRGKQGQAMDSQQQSEEEQENSPTDQQTETTGMAADASSTSSTTAAAAEQTDQTTTALPKATSSSTQTAVATSSSTQTAVAEAHTDAATVETEKTETEPQPAPAVPSYIALASTVTDDTAPNPSSQHYFTDGAKRERKSSLADRIKSVVQDYRAVPGLVLLLTAAWMLYRAERLLCSKKRSRTNSEPVSYAGSAHVSSSDQRTPDGEAARHAPALIDKTPDSYNSNENYLEGYFRSVVTSESPEAMLNTLDEEDKDERQRHWCDEYSPPSQPKPNSLPTHEEGSSSFGPITLYGRSSPNELAIISRTEGQSRQAGVVRRHERAGEGSPLGLLGEELEEDAYDSPEVSPSKPGDWSPPSLLPPPAGPPPAASRPRSVARLFQTLFPQRARREEEGEAEEQEEPQEFTNPRRSPEGEALRASPENKGGAAGRRGSLPRL
eukprot:g27744.t1